MKRIYRLIRDGLTLAGALFLAGPLLAHTPQGAAYDQALSAIGSALPSFNSSASVDSAVSNVESSITQGVSRLGSLAAGQAGPGAPGASSAFLVTGHGPIFLPYSGEL